MNLNIIRNNPSLYKVNTNCINLRVFNKRNISWHDIILDESRKYRKYIPLTELLKIKNVGWKCIRVAFEFNYVKYI